MNRKRLTLVCWLAAGALTTVAFWIYVARDEIAILYARAILSEDHKAHALGAEILASHKDVASIGRLIVVSAACFVKEGCCFDEIDSIVRQNKTLAIEAIIESMKHRNAQVRRLAVKFAASAITVETKSKCVRALSERMSIDSDFKVRYAAATALGLFGGEALPFLFLMLSSTDAINRSNACLAFSMMDVPLFVDAEPALKKIANRDPDAQARLAARFALAKIWNK